MLFTTLSILLLALVFTGAGLLAPWASFRVRPAFPALLAAFWTGWVLVIALLQIWHLVFPINTFAMGVVFGLGFAGWLGARRPLLLFLRSLPRATAAAVAGFAALAALVLAVHIFFIPPHYDHGLYHMPTVSWLGEYAIVPGLGNLHHRLAFNNANFLYAALVNAGFLAERGYWVANTLLAFALIMQCGSGFYRLFRQGDQPLKRAPQERAGFSGASALVEPLYWTFMLPGVLWHLSTTHLPGYSPDVVVFALQAVAGGALLEFFGAPTRGEAGGKALFVVLLPAAGVTVKLSFAPFALLIILATLIAWWARFRPLGRADLRRFAGWAVLAALLIVPWMARGVLLSGYPLFPSTLLGLPVAWRVPDALVSPIAPIILNWARTANQTIPYTGDLAWARLWYAAFPFEVVKRVFMLAAAVGAASALLMGLLRKRYVLRKRAAIDWGSAVLFVLSALGLVAWFLMAPDYRFSGALVWMLLSAGLCFLWHSLAAAGLTRQPLRLAAALALGLTILISPNHFELHKPGQQVLIPNTETDWVRQFVPGEPAQTRVTLSGLIVHMPAPPADQCFSLPAPCTRAQDYLDTLSLFEPGNMQRGFYIQPKGER